MMQITPIRASRPALGPVPRLIEDDTDDILWERAVAHDLTRHARNRTSQPYEIVRRQGDYARRLDAIAAQRGQE